MSKPGFDQETWYGCCSQHVPWDLEHISSLCWEKFLSDSKKRSPSSGSWLKKQRQDCLPRHGGIGHAEEQTSTSLVLLNLDCLLSGLWQKKKKKERERFWIPFVLPFYVAQRKTKAKTCPLKLFSIWKNKQTPFQWETSDLKQDSVKAPSLPVPWGEAPESLHSFIPFTRFSWWLFPFYLSCTNDMLWASFK